MSVPVEIKIPGWTAESLGRMDLSTLGRWEQLANEIFYTLRKFPVVDGLSQPELTFPPKGIPVIFGHLAIDDKYHSSGGSNFIEVTKGVQRGREVLLMTVKGHTASPWTVKLRCRKDQLGEGLTALISEVREAGGEFDKMGHLGDSHDIVTSPDFLPDPSRLVRRRSFPEQHLIKLSML